MNHPVTFIFLSSHIGNVFIFNSDSETEFVWGEGALGDEWECGAKKKHKEAPVVLTGGVEAWSEEEDIVL